MKMIVKIGLDNEMDLILAHRRSMKIAEMCGLNHVLQTRFATAVSEVARCSIVHGEGSTLELGIVNKARAQKEIVAMVSDKADLRGCSPEAYKYAEKLSETIAFNQETSFFVTSLSTGIPFPGTITENRIALIRDYFKMEPPISPYDEIRKKNIQLIDLSEKLSQSESKYRGLSDNLPLLVFTLNSNDELSLANQWLTEYLQQPFSAFNRQGLEKIMHAGDIDQVLQKWQLAKSRQRKFKCEARLLNNNRYVWHLLSVAPQFDNNQQLTSWIGFFVDIDAQKLVEETLKDNTALIEVQAALRTSNSELARKNSELEQFAFIASHDLQEPLRKIMFITSLIERKLAAEERADHLFTRIKAAAQRMSALITDVLNYSRIVDSADHLEKVDLNEVVTNVLDDLDLLISEKDANITVALMPTVFAISSQMYQLLFNLVGNALKFSNDNAEINITVEPQTDYLPENARAGSKYALIRITDNGIGMDTGYSHKIFQMFQRLHNREKFEGNGIGLALCKKIVENHHGNITFTSNIGEGTTFTIALPVIETHSIQNV